MRGAKFEVMTPGADTRMAASSAEHYWVAQNALGDLWRAMGFRGADFYMGALMAEREADERKWQAALHNKQLADHEGRFRGIRQIQMDRMRRR